MQRPQRPHQAPSVREASKVRQPGRQRRAPDGRDLTALRPNAHERVHLPPLDRRDRLRLPIRAHLTVDPLTAPGPLSLMRRGDLIP